MINSVLILHNIRSTYNVGSIFRTADGLGVDKIFLSGYSPTPIDRFGRARSDLHKIALGAEKNIPWEYQRNPIDIIEKLKKAGFYIIAIEQDKKSKDYKKINSKNKTAFIVGNEVRGLAKQILKKVDAIAEIKMQGKKESLNVSVATGIVLSRTLNK